MSDSKISNALIIANISNALIIGHLPIVVSILEGRDLAIPFIKGGKETPLLKEMKKFMSFFGTYINFVNMRKQSSLESQSSFEPNFIENYKRILLLSMQNLLTDNENKLNMKSKVFYKRGVLHESHERELFQEFRQKILNNNIENFDEVIKEFYRFYIVAVLKKQTGTNYFNDDLKMKIHQAMEKDVDSFLQTSEPSGGSRKRRRSSPRKSKKRSSKTTSKGKKKVSKKSKGKKRKSQVKRRSRNNNNRNHGNH
jgi:hypothetical protein